MTMLFQRSASMRARTNADLVEIFRRLDKPSAEGGQPIDLTGWTFAFTVKRSSLGASVLSATLANGKITLSGPGEITIRIDKDDLLAALLPSEEDVDWAYDIVARSPAGVDECWRAGRFLMSRGISP